MSDRDEGSKDDDRAESRGRGDWMKTIPTLIAAVTALITAIAALRKPPDTTATKATYEELSKLVEKLEDSSDQNHQDIVALRNFLEGYIRAEARLVARNDGDAGVGSAASAEPGRVRAPVAGSRTRPPRGGAHAGRPAAGEEPPAADAAPPSPRAHDAKPAPPPAALPVIAPRKDVRRPRDFRDLLKQSQTQDSGDKDSGHKEGGDKDAPTKQAPPPPAPAH